MDSTGRKTNATASDFETAEPFSSLFSTTRDVLFSPRRFFDALPPDGPLGAPVLYFLICSAITAVINTVATLAFLAVPVGIALATGSWEAGLILRLLTVFVFASLVVVPVLFVAGFFVSVPIQHLFILLVAGREQKGLSATLRVSCYSVGAPVAVAWIPVVGFLAIFYCFYLHMVGLKRVHGISTGRSLGATLMLTTILLVLAVALAVYDYRLIQDAMR
ncbi:MAG TPA: YIP1 family protein [Rubrobacter sp.]|nr:YIP1 family protein [Rubrobacter sp.]